jgi:hypothetical protein
MKVQTHHLERKLAVSVDCSNGCFVFGLVSLPLRSVPVHCESVGKRGLHSEVHLLHERSDFKEFDRALAPTLRPCR